jgi:hypothetical protein
MCSLAIPFSEISNAQSASRTSCDEGHAVQFALQRLERNIATQAGSLSRIAK